MSHDILYKLFFYSLKEEKNLFKLEQVSLKEMILKSLHILKLKNRRIQLEKKKENALLYFLSEKGILNLKKLKCRVEKEFQICKKENIRYIGYFSKDYPIHLKELKGPPFMIFYKGYFPNEKELERSLAIIGSRKPEKKYGREVARRMGIFLAQNNWWNISGLAIGCDEYGHMGSLEGKGKTGAILGQGLSTSIYPKENLKLSMEILKGKGFLMSELPPTVSYSSLFFILRDRLQSGMTRGIFVVQTDKSGGALHTIKYSLKQGRKTIIWDPTDIDELKDMDEVLGNRILIENRKEKLGISIEKKLRKKILKIKQAKEIFEVMKKEEKKEVVFHNKTLF
ncbi:MAG TPA: hypothetical protein DCR90_00150 [Fusobacteriaceae bacterium]|nr:hypothetical protein [Fusobacteriaceae bacterium]